MSSGNGPTAALTNSMAVKNAPARLTAIWRVSVVMNIENLPFGEPLIGLKPHIAGSVPIEKKCCNSTMMDFDWEITLR